MEGKKPKSMEIGVSMVLRPCWNAGSDLLTTSTELCCLFSVKVYKNVMADNLPIGGEQRTYGEIFAGQFDFAIDDVRWCQLGAGAGCSGPLL